MGTYLDKPVTEKESQDMENDRILCGASSMQGWREAQEDAHNCILDFDKKVSLFAVFDGHGGAEVAQYAATKLPSMVKNELYENSKFEEALKKAFLDFDDSLLDDIVVDQLDHLRDKFNEGDSVDDGEDDKVEELNELYEEANTPLEQLIMKYKKDILEKIESCVNPDDRPTPEQKEEILQKIADSIYVGDSPSCKAEEEALKSSSSTSSQSSNTGNSLEAESSSSDKVNGTPKNNEENETEESSVETSAAESGPSSSNGQNGSGQKFGTACFIADDSEDSDDSDDALFEAPNSSTNNDLEDDSDSDSDEDDGETMFNEDYDSEDEEKSGKDSGCTAVMALLIKDKLYVANAGDSRCVVSIDGKAHDMSKDHKPEDELELKRITAAGGRVSSDGRVNGGLNLSRALGDHNYKKNKNLPNTEQMITALPDLSFLDLKSGKAEFIVLACDGIWNSLSSQEVVDFISERINKPGVKLSSICEELFDKCLAPNTLSDGTGCDNMTCIIAKLKEIKKRSHSDDESEEDTECKKLKTESQPGPVNEPEPELAQPESELAQPEVQVALENLPKPDLVLDSEAARESSSVRESGSGT